LSPTKQVGIFFWSQQNSLPKKLHSRLLFFSLHDVDAGLCTFLRWCKNDPSPSVQTPLIIMSLAVHIWFLWKISLENFTVTYCKSFGTVCARQFHVDAQTPAPLAYMNSPTVFAPTLYSVLVENLTIID